MVALNVCPSTLASGFTEYSKPALKALFDGKKVSFQLPYEALDTDRETAIQVQKGNGRISLSGVQSKYAMIVENGQLRFTHEGEQGRYILKPIPTSNIILDRAFCPANEHLSMQIAHQVYGIETAANGLCFFGNGHPAYVTRRFDIRPDGGKYSMEDFAAVAGLNTDNGGENYKYDKLSYEDCAELIKKHVKAAPIEILKFFRLVIFNYLICNDDAHLKNFTLIERSKGDYVLAPAYDLMNTFLHLAEPSVFALQKGLFKEGMYLTDTHSVNGKSFVEFGIRIGLSNKIINNELERFTAVYPQLTTLIENSFLSDRLKKDYVQTLDYRRITLKQK